MAGKAKKSLWRHPSIIFLAVLLFAAGFTVYSYSPDSIEIVHSTRGPAMQAVYATGTVEATVMMPIAPRISARIMELNVDEGSDVKKGQVLASMEDEDFLQTVKELQAQEEYAKKEYERREGLMRSGAISRSEYEKFFSEWKSAKAMLAKADAEHRFMQLVAPADGRIIRRDGEVGQLIPVNQPIFWLTCCSDLRISAEVDEEDIALVQPGQKVLIRADAFPGKVFHGEVQSITPKGDAVARSYRVRIGFTGKTPLMIGMTAETNIIVRETEDALLVPSGAVTLNKLWLAVDGKLEPRDIVVGAKGLKQTEVISGVTASDNIVLHPMPDFVEGKQIRTHLVRQEE